VAYVFYSYDLDDAYNSKNNVVARAGATLQQGQSINANLIWSPVPQVNIGGEYIWSQFNYYDAANTTVHRLQISFQYKF
jgi:hypothetical protein